MAREKQERGRRAISPDVQSASACEIEREELRALLEGAEAEVATLRARLEAAEGHAAEPVQEWMATVDQVEAVRVLAKRWAQRGLLRDVEGTITGHCARELREALGEGEKRG